MLKVYETLPGGNRGRHMTVVSPPGLVFDFQRQLSPFFYSGKNLIYKYNFWNKEIGMPNFYDSKWQKLFHIIRWQLFPVSIFAGSVEKRLLAMHTNR